jgi:CheY-like chemotaxis protein
LTTTGVGDCTPDSVSEKMVNPTMARSSMPVGKPRVLVMDDSDLVLQVTAEVLERDGFEVRTVQSLGQFNVALRAWSPTLVLTDVNMPGLNGGELCKWIKARVDTQSVPVILFSDIADTELEALAHRSGADGFLSKRAGTAQLSRKLAAICEELIW